MRSGLVTLCLLLVSVGWGCASTTRPEGVPAPSLDIARFGGPTGAGVTRQLQGAFPVSFALLVRNNADVPLHLTRIELESIGEGAYILRRKNQAYDLTIDAHEEEVIELWAAARAGSSVTGIGGQVTVRAVFYFDVDGETFREVLTRNLRGSGAAR